MLVKRIVGTFVCISVFALAACKPNQQENAELVPIGETASGEIVYGHAQDGASNGFSGSSFLMGALAGQVLGGLTGRNGRGNLNPQDSVKKNQLNTNKQSAGNNSQQKSYDSSQLRFRDDDKSTSNQKYRQVQPKKNQYFNGSQKRSGRKGFGGRRR